MKKRISDIAIEVMLDENSNYIGYNEYGMLDEVWSRSFDAGIVKEIGSRGGMNRSHPINKQNVVLAALDRDPRFEKSFIRCCDRNGIAERLVREFRLKDKP